MKREKIILFVLLVLESFKLAAQAPDVAVQTTTTVQPKIMVIPYTKESEDIRTILEDDINKRIVLTKIKESFDSRGFTTVDFTAKLKSAGDNAIFAADTKSDLKSQIIQTSGADIYVEAEIDLLLASSGNSVKIIITAYEISTGNSLANKIGDSGKFYTEDIGRLASKAIDSCAEEFLNVMQSKFDDIVMNGKSVIINFSFAEGSLHTMASEVGNQGLLLSDELELWMEGNAYKNNYHIQGTTDYQMIFDDVRIPLKDPTNGNNYNPNKFALELFKFMRNLGLKVSRDIKGNTIFISIQ